MLTIENLKELGADTEGGLARCINNEEFYLKMVNLSLQDANFEKLRSAIDGGDMDGAFEAAHALKGVLGNLALTPLYERTSEITELLRADKDADYQTLLDEILKQRDALAALRDN